MKLGSYPTNRYHKSWITQRLVNRAPDWSQIRKSPVSVGQQVLNPIATTIEETLKQLSVARQNMFLTSADLNDLGLLYYLEIDPAMEFQYTEDSSGLKTYTPPRVYATIAGTEYEITQAYENNIETLKYNCLVSRIEDAEVSHTYMSVIPRTQISNLSSVSPGSVVPEGYLYITLEDNETWEVRTTDTIYFTKCYITGTTRKGTEVTEVVPLRYNGTFKTLNEWQSVETVMISYADQEAYVTIKSFPWAATEQLDNFNVLVLPEGGERSLFLDIESHTWGSSLATKGFTLNDMDIVRSGVEEKEIYCEIELLDSDSNNVTINGFVKKPNSRFIYAVDNNNFYVYDSSLELPDTRRLVDESPETKIDLWSSRWIYPRDDVGYIQTRNMAVSDPPSRVRWTLEDPNGSTYYIALDGSLWATTTDGWIENISWGEGLWHEQKIPIAFTSNGIYIVTLEALYWSDVANTSTIYKTKFFFYVPSITPEAQFSLPATLVNPEAIGMDSDLKLWLKKNSQIYKLDIFHDYFLVDYEKKRVWCNESYSNLRVTI